MYSIWISEKLNILAVSITKILWYSIFGNSKGIFCKIFNALCFKNSWCSFNANGTHKIVWKLFSRENVPERKKRKYQIVGRDTLFPFTKICRIDYRIDFGTTAEVFKLADQNACVIYIVFQRALIIHFSNWFWFLWWLKIIEVSIKTSKCR